MNIEPISSLLRPKTIDGFVGQVHLVDEGKPISVFIKNGKIPSMIFWGPPGSGKTTLAHIIANTLESDFFYLSGVTSKKDDLKDILEHAKNNFDYGKLTILFLDEIHRWNKAQQDTLLPYVEKGIIILVGATTENPSFSINNALISRCRVFVFEKLGEDDIYSFIKKNMSLIQDKHSDITISDQNIMLIARLGNGDLRNSLNILESAILIKNHGEISETDILNAGQKQVYYDRNGEEHYNIISALHKSLRDSDVDASCYRLQRMLAGGEDPLYIARRLVRFASEDIGLADNNALLLSTTVYTAVNNLGMPECDVCLFQLVIYLAKAKKDNTVYRVSKETKYDVEKYGNLSVPMNIRNAPTKLMKDLGYGKDYKYAHDYPDAKVDQQHMPDQLKDKKYL